MNLLFIAPNYPHDAAEWFGAQNERTALALRRIVKEIVVLSPRPFAPRFLAINERWRGYTRIPRDPLRRGIRVCRPPYFVIPRLLSGVWQGRGAFLASRAVARALHREIRFDAILSFDLAATGELAWRIGADLEVPACGWATGSDVRVSGNMPAGRNVSRALRKLDLVFYQNSELRALAAQRLGVSPEDLPDDRHVVQARGVIAPETLPDDDVRRSIRDGLQLADDHVVILHLGRIVRGKGLFELVDGFGQWARGRSELVLLLLGAIPGQDDSPELEKKIRTLSGVEGRVRILPACAPGRIWDYFAAADVFAFPSFREGMPNSLLEAMLAGVPAVAFSIPAVQDITRFGEALVEVPAYDFSMFGDAILKLASDARVRRDVGERGRAVAQTHFSLHRSMRAAVERIERLVRS